jgi:hypothetical protein
VKNKWMGYAFLAIMPMVFAILMNLGCNQSLPSLNKMAPPATPLPQTSWYFETNTNIGPGKGNWNDTGMNAYAGTPVPGTVSWAKPGYNGSVGCLEDSLTFLPGASESCVIQYTPLSPLNFIGLGVNGISAEIWIDGSLDNNAYVQFYFESGSGSTWEWSSDINLTPNAWNNVSFIPNWSKSGENPDDVESFWFAIQTGTNGTGGSGNIKLDNIVLNPGIIKTPTPTLSPTPTTSPQPTATPSDYWYFATSSDLNGWTDTGLNTYNGSPVTGLLSWASGGFNGAAGCLTDSVTFTGTGVTDSVQYTFPSPLNFSGMNLTTIQGEVWIDGSLDTGSPRAQVYVSSGAWGYSGYTNLTQNGWTLVAYQPQWSNSGENSTNLKSFWFTTRPGSSDTVGSGNIKLDDIILY